MARVSLITWQDLVDHLIDWMGANPTAEARRDARRAILTAMREIANIHAWTYYYTLGRLVTAVPYSTGTIAYDHTGGAYERLVTLTSGTWPDWASLGFLVVNDIRYDVSSRISATQITLSVNSNPGSDLSSGTTYTLIRDQYTLPSNFQSMGEVILVDQSRNLHFEHPSKWLSRQRVWRGTGTPYTYSIFGDPNYQNTLTIAFYPPPDDDYAIDYLYRRRPRELRVENYSTGTVAGSGSSTGLTGTGTSWTSSMVGSVIRIGTTTDTPTGRAGSNPPYAERIVTAVSSSTSITVDAAWDETFSNRKYVISDPVDIEVGSMMTALLRRAEMETGHARNKRDRDGLEQSYQRELIRAREADARNFQEQQAGRMAVYPLRPADFPLGDDV